MKESYVTTLVLIPRKKRDSGDGHEGCPELQSVFALDHRDATKKYFRIGTASFPLEFSILVLNVLDQKVVEKLLYWITALSKRRLVSPSHQDS